MFRDSPCAGARRPGPPATDRLRRPGKPAIARAGSAALPAILCALATFAVALQAHGQATTSEAAAGTDVPRSPEAGGPRRWSVTADGTLGLRDARASDAAVVEAVADGAVLSNLGCVLAEDRVWCEVRPVRGGVGGFAAAEFLRPATGPDGTVPHGEDDSARRARNGDFDAHGRAPCAQVRGQELGECAVSVARGTGGDATVVVTFGNGFARTLSFVHGAFVSANATMSGVGTDTDWRIEDATHVIRVDDQTYELPDALVFGD